MAIDKSSNTSVSPEVQPPTIQKTSPTNKLDDLVSFSGLCMDSVMDGFNTPQEPLGLDSIIEGLDTPQDNLFEGVFDGAGNPLNNRMDKVATPKAKIHDGMFALEKAFKTHAHKLLDNPSVDNSFAVTQLIDALFDSVRMAEWHRPSPNEEVYQLAMRDDVWYVRVSPNELTIFKGLRSFPLTSARNATPKSIASAIYNAIDSAKNAIQLTKVELEGDLGWEEDDEAGLDESTLSAHAAFVATESIEIKTTDDLAAFIDTIAHKENFADYSLTLLEVLTKTVGFPEWKFDSIEKVYQLWLTYKNQEFNQEFYIKVTHSDVKLVQVFKADLKTYGGASVSLPTTLDVASGKNALILYSILHGGDDAGSELQESDFFGEALRCVEADDETNDEVRMCDDIEAAEFFESPSREKVVQEILSRKEVRVAEGIEFEKEDKQEAVPDSANVGQVKEPLPQTTLFPQDMLKKKKAGRSERSMTQDEIVLHLKSTAGRVLTVMEAAFPNESQREAVKTLIKKEFRREIEKVGKKFMFPNQDESDEDAEQIRNLKL